MAQSQTKMFLHDVFYITKLTKRLIVLETYCYLILTPYLSLYLDLFAFSLIDMSLWKKKNLKSIFQT